ncbi:Cwf15/Cwc15 cell cycle control family protein [Emericellopsis atlantica]|uniref:Cwf15/Cwc15 cell cycle control family protein n=1 Tax=Emericellopsis atlantica TaxID=2614577 RepID=A0A9P8CLZ7_9HYPO|nr:Cwf15/Cwc15 cell cycle control family protein [Emericellopsis atlantica]KAG9251547.1 Cwf15/Cwc15 cell cycle control family protein [Emericellopsis atlantica]
MTTAHRPTFDPAKGKEALRGPAYHTRNLPAHTTLKFRQAAQGLDDEATPATDLAAELLAAEAAHFAKKNGGALPEPEHEDDDAASSVAGHAAKRRHSTAPADGEEEDFETKRRRILEESREMDADDTDSDEASDSDSDSDSDDEDAELQRELERVRREREEKKKREEEQRAKAEQEERERDIAVGNPLLNKQDFTMKRRWDDDVVFKNQARGTDDKGKKEFVNDMIRSDFHRRFMSKYVR